MLAAGAIGNTAATVGFATGGVNTCCGRAAGRGDAGVVGFAPCGFAVGFRVDLLGEARAGTAAPGLVEDEDPLDG